MDQTMIQQHDFWDIIAQIDTELKRINWSESTAKAYLDFHYGVTSRMKLKDAELLEFLAFLKQQPTQKSGLPKLPKLPKLKGLPPF